MKVTGGDRSQTSVTSVCVEVWRADEEEPERTFWDDVRVLYLYLGGDCYPDIYIDVNASAVYVIHIQLLL